LPPELEAAFGAGVTEEQRVEWKEWVSRYRSTLEQEGLNEEDRRKLQNEANPKFIPRQHLLQLAIDEAEKGQFEELKTLMKVLERPYEDQSNAEKYSRPPSEDMVKPGVTFLSCSS